MLSENLSINITPNGVPTVIHITQYDVGLRRFVFTPYTSEGTFTPDTAASATLEGTKPDGNAFVHNCSYNSSTGVITYTIQEQLAAVAGRVWSKLVVRNTSGAAIGYAAIIWIVDMAGVQDDAIVSDSDLSALEEFVNEFGTINAYRGALNGALAAVGSPLVASTAASMTDRTKVYVYTGSESGYTNGHWYYWNGSAWTDGGVYNSVAVNTDKTLTVANMAADAKATGDEISELKNNFNDLGFIKLSSCETANGWINNNNVWTNIMPVWVFAIIPVSSGDTVELVKGNKTGFIAFVTDFVTPVSGQAPLFSSQSGFTTKINLTTGQSYSFVAPSDAKYILLNTLFDGIASEYDYVKINGYDILLPALDNLTSKINELSEMTGDAVSELKNDLIESENLSGVNAGLIRSETFTLGKTFDGNGIPVDASNRAITDFIRCAGSSVLVVVPLDGSVKTNLYIYDANKNHIAHGTYNNTTRVVYNQNAVYVRFVLAYNDNSTADQKLLDSVRIYNNIERMGGIHRGNVVKLGYTTLAQCESDGYYSFGVNDISSITDLPYDIRMGDSGGIVQTFSYYAGGIPLQVIFAKGKMYYRYGVNPFIPVSEDAVADVAITWEKGAINQTTGADAASSFRIRTFGKVPINEGVKVTVPTEMEASIIAYNANDERIYTTGLQQQGIFYHFPQKDETYFRIYGGYIDKRTTITADDGKKYGIQYIPIASDAPMWYALGDSITQGFYSEVGTSGIAGETPNGYPTYAALANGWRLRNMGVGGSGYIKASDTLSKPNAKGQVDTIDFSYCDICTLAFGVNDWHYNQQIGTVEDSKTLGTTMASNMKYVIEKILTDNPLCRLNIMLPLNCATYGGDFDSDWGLGTSLPTSGTLQHVIDVIKGVAELYHLPIIDQSNTGIANRFNILEVLPDGCHPALETMKPYGERIAKQIV